MNSTAYKERLKKCSSLYTGKFGVRVEDTVVVGKGGQEVLTSFRRKLEI